MVNTSTVIYFNGNLQKNDEKTLFPQDRGFLFGDGLFETLRSYQGNLVFLAHHWRRLQGSAQQLGIPFDMPLAELNNVIQSLLAANNLLTQDAGIRITLSRGIGERGLLPPRHPSPTLIISSFDAPILPIAPIKLHISNTTRRNEYSPLSRLKSLNYLDNILAMQAATHAGANDALLLNTQGLVAETTIANIFMVKNEQIFTPRIEDGALPGVMRKLIIQLCQTEGISCEEKTISLSELLASEEIFITNALREICPVHEIVNNIYMPQTEDTLTSYLQNALKRRF